MKVAGSAWLMTKTDSQRQQHCTQLWNGTDNACKDSSSDLNEISISSNGTIPENAWFDIWLWYGIIGYHLIGMRTLFGNENSFCQHVKPSLSELQFQFFLCQYSLIKTNWIEKQLWTLIDNRFLIRNTLSLINGIMEVGLPFMPSSNKCSNASQPSQGDSRERYVRLEVTTITITIHV